VVKMVQKYFKNSWLLPCSLRSHRTAHPRPKMASPFLGFAHPPPEHRLTPENGLMFKRFLANKSKNNNHTLN